MQRLINYIFLMSDCTTITENNMRYGNPISTEKRERSTLSVFFFFKSIRCYFVVHPKNQTKDVSSFSHRRRNVSPNKNGLNVIYLKISIEYMYIYKFSYSAQIQ